MQGCWLWAAKEPISEFFSSCEKKVDSPLRMRRGCPFKLPFSTEIDLSESFHPPL